jgi:hypothetical protein
VTRSRLRTITGSLGFLFLGGTMIVAGVAEVIRRTAGIASSIAAALVVEPSNSPERPSSRAGRRVEVSSGD